MSESLVISQPPDKSRRPRVVIIGGGFAGIAAVKALRHCEADVTVIDRRNITSFNPCCTKWQRLCLHLPMSPHRFGSCQRNNKTCRCCWLKLLGSTWDRDP